MDMMVAFEWDENRRFAWRVKAAGRTSVIVVETGFGDGTCPIKTLVSAGKTVGVDIMFIPAGAKYPF